MRIARLLRTMLLTGSLVGITALSACGSPASAPTTVPSFTSSVTASAAPNATANCGDHAVVSNLTVPQQPTPDQRVVNGTVTCLEDGHELWMFVRRSDTYYRLSDTPVKRDATGEFVAVGRAGFPESNGEVMSLIFVDANQAASVVLAHGPDTLPVLPPGATALDGGIKMAE